MREFFGFWIRKGKKRKTDQVKYMDAFSFKKKKETVHFFSQDDHEASIKPELCHLVAHDALWSTLLCAKFQ